VDTCLDYYNPTNEATCITDGVDTGTGTVNCTSGCGRRNVTDPHGDDHDDHRRHADEIEIQAVLANTTVPAADQLVGSEYFDSKCWEVLNTPELLYNVTLEPPIWAEVCPASGTDLTTYPVAVNVNGVWTSSYDQCMSATGNSYPCTVTGTCKTCPVCTCSNQLRHGTPKKKQPKQPKGTKSPKGTKGPKGTKAPKGPSPTPADAGANSGKVYAAIGGALGLVGGGLLVVRVMHKRVAKPTFASGPAPTSAAIVAHV